MTISEIIRLHNTHTSTLLSGPITSLRNLTFDEIAANQKRANEALNEKTKEELIQFIKSEYFQDNIYNNW